MDALQKLIQNVIKEIFGVDIEPELTRPDEQFGDFSTNVALQLATKIDSPPAGGTREIAEQLVTQLKNPNIAKVEVAGPGFINFWLTDQALAGLLDKQPAQKLAGQEVVVEYSDPNPFKVLHVGHLYTSVVGDAIAKLFEAARANVHRVNFGGDVGLHVGKTMWAILDTLTDGSMNEIQAYDELIKISSKTLDEKSAWLAEQYIKGTKAYEENEENKAQIIVFSKKVYHLHAVNDHESNFGKVYWTCRKWSYDYFDEFYKQIGSGFEKYYPESATVEPGMKIVQANIGKVFEESEGAIIFKGEVHSMHTRVFINSQGLPTYETKDVGLIMLKNDDYHFDRSVIITGNEQFEYMQVVLKAVEQIMPDLAKKTTHITHGMVKLAGGVKMSSRLGNTIGAEDVLQATFAANIEINQQENHDTALGAVKYAFLKHRIGTDIIFDPAESVSLQGNSGPYLQYAYVRAKSILGKAQNEVTGYRLQVTDFEAWERSLARKISEYPEVVENAINELMPHHVATYLYELAQVFNRFYENNRVIGDPREKLRLQLVGSYVAVLQAGLELLNIPIQEKM